MLVFAEGKKRSTISNNGIISSWTQFREQELLATLCAKFSGAAAWTSGEEKQEKLKMTRTNRKRQNKQKKK